MRKDPGIFLKHILESIDAIEEYLEGVEEEEFYTSREKQDLIIRRLEIIGEAAKNIPEDFRKQDDNIPWKKMAGMRDVIIHQYFGINYKIVWDTVEKTLPLIKKQIMQVINREKES